MSDQPRRWPRTFFPCVFCNRNVYGNNDAHLIVVPSAKARSDESWLICCCPTCWAEVEHRLDEFDARGEWQRATP